MSSSRLEELVEALEALPAGEREAYLERVCPDSELRREALSVFAAASRSTDYLERYAKFVEGLGARRPVPPDLTGRRVGAYRLTRLLGRGGMGVVYEAERADGAFVQRVALKLLPTAVAGAESHARFLAERQILAGLEHPAIARIVDGGITDEGTPWFAMERVEGEPIDAYSDRLRLGIRERLELFLQVCDAVEHAHRRLVVHRDLKPANVLVTEERKVKLLDFGIATLLDGEEATVAPPTRAGLRVMTPEYASPEQVRGEAVTTASDVYQLGLLLYELLTGHRPYTLGRRSPSEMERVICEQSPTRPSTVVSRDEALKPTTGLAAPSLEEVCRARRASPTRLRRRLRGDLENIVLKALSKEPGRRYGSADRLAQDIRRHIDGLPVTARPDTWVYRSRKFVERHALGASTAALVLILVTALTAFYTMRIRNERDQAQASERRAQAEAAKAAQMNEFLTGLFRGADPREAGGTAVTAQELLDRGVEQVDHELATQPETQADMLRILGRTYLEMGVYDSAERLLTRALELRRRHLGPRHPKVAEVLGDLGLLRFQQREYARARTPLEAAVDILEAASGDETSELANELRILGQTLGRLGEYESARAAFERALAIERRWSGEDSNETARILQSLATLAKEMGDLEVAEDLYEQALATFERTRGRDHPWVGITLMNLANVRIERGAVEGVEVMYRRSLRIVENTYGLDHDRAGVALVNLGSFLNIVGRHDKAVEVLHRALDVLGAAVGPESSVFGYALVTLGDAHRGAGRLREARQFYQRSLAVLESAIEGRQLDVGLVSSLVGLGRVEAELGNLVAAERFLNRATAMWRQAPEAVDPQLTPTLLDLGRWLAEERRCAEARSLLRRVHPSRTSQHPGWSSEATELETLLAECTNASTGASTTAAAANPS